MTQGRRRAAGLLLLLAAPVLGSCASANTYEAPGGRLSVVVVSDTGPPDRIWEITSHGPEDDWSVGCLSDDGPGGSFRDITWIDAVSFEVVTSEGRITVRVDESGRPAAADRELGFRPCT